MLFDRNKLLTDYVPIVLQSEKNLYCKSADYNDEVTSGSSVIFSLALHR